MKIALRALSCNSTFDSFETPENFSSTAFHNPCSIREDRILIFQRLKLVPSSNFGTSYFADAVGTPLDAISSRITHEPIHWIFHAPRYCWFGDIHPCWPTRCLPTPAVLVDKADALFLLLIRQQTGISRLIRYISRLVDVSPPVSQRP